MIYGFLFLLISVSSLAANNDESEITTYIARDQNLSGDFPPLEHLEVLDLSWNNYSGAIPPLDTRVLKELYLNFNRFSRFPATLNLPHLRVLDVSNNQLTGYIPDGLSDMPLVYLDLSDNKLQGPLPQSFENMKYLRFLSVSYNQLSGPLINFPPSLEILYIDHNQFRGSLFPSLSQLNLTYFNGEGNQFSIPIPQCFIDLKPLGEDLSSFLNPC